MTESKSGRLAKNGTGVGILATPAVILGMEDVGSRQSAILIIKRNRRLA